VIRLLPAPALRTSTIAVGAPVRRHHVRASRVVASVVLAALATGCGQASRDDEGAIVESGTAAVDDLRVGDCFDDPADLSDEVVEVADVDATPCDEPHDNEVFHAFDLPGDELPADEAIEEQVGEECIPAFDAYVGTAYEDSELDLFAIWPTTASWDEGDRAVTCALFAMDGSKLDESVRDSGR
jgi:hypothetical protein